MKELVEQGRPVDLRTVETKRRKPNNLPALLKPIALAAAETGVIIRPDGSWQPLKTENSRPTLKELQKAVNGTIDFVGIPNGNQVSDKTMLVVNDEGDIKDLEFNQLASYVAMQQLVGNVVWLPKGLLS